MLFRNTTRFHVLPWLEDIHRIIWKKIIEYIPLRNIFIISIVIMKMSSLQLEMQWLTVSAVQRLEIVCRCADRGNYRLCIFLPGSYVLTPHQLLDNRELAQRYALETSHVLERRTKKRQILPVHHRMLGLQRYWCDKEAVRYYQLATEQGCTDAQFNLGVMFEKVTGVPQSYQESSSIL